MMDIYIEMFYHFCFWYALYVHWAHSSAIWSYEWMTCGALYKLEQLSEDEDAHQEEHQA